MPGHCDMGRKSPERAASASRSQVAPPVSPAHVSRGPLFEFFPLPVTTPQTHTVHGDQVPSAVTGIKKDTLLRWE